MKINTSTSIQLCLLACTFLSTQSITAETAVVVDQPTSPLKIDTYTAEYSPKDRYSREGIVHKVSLTNTSDQKVVAYKVTFNSFDVFNNDMGRGLGGISVQTIDSGQSTSGSWRQSPYAVFSFEKYGTGVAYVSTVRLENGTVWTFNEQEVLAELKKISQDLTADIFEDGEE